MESYERRLNSAKDLPKFLYKYYPMIEIIYRSYNDEDAKLFDDLVMVDKTKYGSICPIKILFSDQLNSSDCTRMNVVLRYDECKVNCIEKLELRVLGENLSKEIDSAS